MLDENGDPIATTVTEDDGSYEFTGLDAGTYSVDFPTEVGGKVLVDSNVGDGDEPAVSGVTVELLDENGMVVATEVTGTDGTYIFTGLTAGDYQVRFPSAVGALVLIDPNAGDDTSDSDAVDNNDGTATTGVISLALGENSVNNDAGLENPNQDPVAADDAAKVCADETTTINLLEGDTDPDAGDTISVVSISDNDETAGVGESITLDSGAVVTLNADGTVEYDGIAAFADLPIGMMDTDSFEYTIEDDNGGSDDGAVDVTVCGALNTKETISASLPQSGNIEISFPQPANDQTYQVTITNSGQLDGVYDGWCIDKDGALVFQTTLDGDWYSSTSEADLDELEANGQLPAGAGDNMDQVNWIINNTDDLYTDGFTQNQIQLAIWQLTDGFIDANPVTATAQQDIVDQAVEGYMPEEGGLFGVIFAPTDDSQTFGERGQTFIVAVPWEALEEDCIC